MHRNASYGKLQEMTVPPLLGSSLEGSDFVLAEWFDDGESSVIVMTPRIAALVAALHEPDVHALFRRFDSELLAWIHRISPAPPRKERRFSHLPPLDRTRPRSLRSSGTE